MTISQTTAHSADTTHRQESWQIALVSAAHFVSHYFIMLLPPLFVFIKDDYGVTYTELGLAFVAFNVVTAVLQTPAGFLVDRIGARPLLIGGLVLGAAAIAVASLVDSFWVFVAMFGVAGLANTVYHPADYAILSNRISAGRMGHAFAVHTFAGMLGGAAAPVTLLLMHTLIGWRGAFLGAALLGFATAAAFLLLPDGAPARQQTGKSTQTEAGDGPTGWRLLMSMPILQNLLFFVLLTLANSGVQNYAIVALGALYGTPVGLANTAVSGYLLLSALGVLLGGFVASRTSRHAAVAAAGLSSSGAAILLVAVDDPGAVALVFLLSLGGLLHGLIMPSRDLIVRESTPAGSFGKVFGFVTTGFNIGGIVAPFIFGAMLDNNAPRGVFIFTAVASIAAIFAVITIPRTRTTR